MTGGHVWADVPTTAAALGLALPAGFEDQARTYLAELARWERVGRLTGYASETARVRHLVIESLMLLAAVPAPGAPLLDIGSGAGIPGLIVKLARPTWAVGLVEAARRRANFLRHVARQLGLAELTVYQDRAEAIGGDTLRGRFHTVTMRAVAGESAATRLARPFLAPGGVLVVPLAPGARPRHGTVRAVTAPLGKELPFRRRFLIIARTELEDDVSRGTRAPGEPRDRGGQPEGRRREDDHGA